MLYAQYLSLQGIPVEQNVSESGSTGRLSTHSRTVRPEGRGQPMSMSSVRRVGLSGVSNARLPLGAVGSRFNRNAGHPGLDCAAARTPLGTRALGTRALGTSGGAQQTKRKHRRRSANRIKAGKAPARLVSIWVFAYLSLLVWHVLSGVVEGDIRHGLALPPGLGRTALKVLFKPVGRVRGRVPTHGPCD